MGERVRLGAAKKGREEERERLGGEANSWELGSLSWSQKMDMCLHPRPATPTHPLSWLPVPLPAQANRYEPLGPHGSTATVLAVELLLDSSYT